MLLRIFVRCFSVGYCLTIIFRILHCAQCMFSAEHSYSYAPAVYNELVLCFKAFSARPPVNKFNLLVDCAKDQRA